MRYDTGVNENYKKEYDAISVVGDTKGATYYRRRYRVHRVIGTALFVILALGFLPAFLFVLSVSMTGTLSSLVLIMFGSYTVFRGLSKLAANFITSASFDKKRFKLLSNNDTA